VNNGLVTLNNSTLANNQADTGGAAYLYDGTVAPDLDASSVFNGGSNINYGYVASGTLTLNNSTLSVNQAETGGGIYVESGTLNSTNSIIAGNTATISGPNLFGTITAGSNNLTSGDPMLGALTDNGASTWTMLPLQGSPAIEGGIDTGSLPATDQRGYPRLLGATVDIGAVEVTSLIVSSPADSGQGTLRQIVADAAPGDIITFSDFMDGETILLTSGEITVNKDVTIDTSSLPSGITFDGNDNGRIFAFSSGTYVFDRVTLLNGRASGVSPDNKGGAIYLENAANLTLTSSTLSGHSADQGGAIYLNDGTLTLLNSTISANEADIGGGIYRNSGTLNSTNSIVAGNTATATDPNLFGAITAGSNNLTSGDPMLGPLADNGGPTWTMLPLPGSPAIDAGIDTGSLPSTDQRGLVRNLGATVDIGAVETQQSTVVSRTGDSGVGSLRQTIEEASPVDTITFANTLSGQTIILTTGQITMSKDLTVDASALAGGITLDGNANSRIFEFAPGTTSALTGFTLTNGEVSGASPDNQGGAIYISETANLTLTDITVSNNTAIEGGGIYNDGNLTLNNTTLSDNTSSFDGGGIFNERASTLTIDHSTFSFNEASSGGAILNDSSVTISNSTFSENFANSSGGAIANEFEAVLTLSRSTLSYNYADTNGGGIYNDGDLTLNSSTLFANETFTDGGAIFNDNDGNLTLNNSTLSINIADTNGGGILNEGNLTLNNSTLAGNEASNSGGGIYSDTGSLTLDNSIVANNTADTSDNIEGSIDAGDDNITSGDPMLFPLGDYGGPTQTMPPLADSPAIDNGNNSIVESVFPYDQRGPGFNRISGGWVDIGACELRQQTPLLDWRILHGLDPDGDDDFANPSGDGISNILKYAFNLAPFAGDLQTSNTRVVSPDGISGLPLIGATEEGLLFITFVRRKASSFPEISYEPSSGSDLGNFAPLSLDSATVTSIDDEWERVTVVDPVASDTRFGRIGVTN
jgi:predicted outer membrane repeat protein